MWTQESKNEKSDFESKNETTGKMKEPEIHLTSPCINKRCLCPFDSEVCVKAKATRKSFFEAIVEEDVDKFSALVSQVAEDRSLEDLYKMRCPCHFGDEPLQAAATGATTVAGGKTVLMLAVSKGLVVSVECL